MESDSPSPSSLSTIVSSDIASADGFSPASSPFLNRVWAGLLRLPPPPPHVLSASLCPPSAHLFLSSAALLQSCTPSSSSLSSTQFTSHPLPFSSTLLPIVRSLTQVQNAPRSAPSSLSFRSFFSSSPANQPYKEYKLPPPVNPPDADIPDQATLREQWNNAIRLYSRWYGHAWGTAILGGFLLFLVGWQVKGENPLKHSKFSKKEDEASEASKEANTAGKKDDPSK